MSDVNIQSQISNLFSTLGLGGDRNDFNRDQFDNLLNTDGVSGDIFANFPQQVEALAGPDGFFGIRTSEFSGAFQNNLAGFNPSSALSRDENDRTAANILPEPSLLSSGLSETGTLIGRFAFGVQGTVQGDILRQAREALNANNNPVSPTGNLAGTATSADEKAIFDAFPELKTLVEAYRAISPQTTEQTDIGANGGPTSISNSLSAAGPVDIAQQDLNEGLTSQNGTKGALTGATSNPTELLNGENLQPNVPTQSPAGSVETAPDASINTATPVQSVPSVSGTVSQDSETGNEEIKATALTAAGRDAGSVRAQQDAVAATDTPSQRGDALNSKESNNISGLEETDTNSPNGVNSSKSGQNNNQNGGQNGNQNGPNPQNTSGNQSANKNNENRADTFGLERALERAAAPSDTHRPIIPRENASPQEFLPLSSTVKSEFFASGIAGGLAALKGEQAPGPQGLFGGQPSLYTAQQAVSQVHLAVGKAVNAGNTEFTVSLSPDELGKVTVRLQFSDDDTVRAQVIARSPEALEALQRDSRSLERALEAGGHKLSGDGLSFGLEKGDEESAGKSLAEAILQEKLRGELAANAAGNHGKFSSDTGEQGTRTTDKEAVPLDEILPYITAETGVDIRI